MAKTKVGVLRGGPSSEHEVSLVSGAAVLEHLPSDKYTPIDIVVGHDRVFRIDGEREVVLEDLQKYIDVGFLAFHGEFGEDGTVQSMLDAHAIPYNGAGEHESRIAFNKQATRKVLAGAGLTIATGMELTADTLDLEKVQDFFETSVSHRVVVKPNTAGSSVGISIADDFDALIAAIDRAFETSDTVLLEEYIDGREGTCGVLEGFDGVELATLPPIEIVPPEHADFFDETVKYDGTTQEICPGNFSEAKMKEIAEIGRIAHQALGLRHYSRTDFILTPDGRFVVLETNTLPGLTPESLFPKAVAAAGMEFSGFLHHLVQLAIRK